jgi:hypothetical protein
MVNVNALSRLSALEQQYGLPKSTLAGMWGVESDFGRAQDRPRSQYRGPFQLGDSVRRQYGVSNPSDFFQSADAAARLAADNMKGLTAKLGREPTPAELYLAHQQGMGGASKLLTHPDQPAGMLTNPQFIKANAGDPNAPASTFSKMFGDRFNQKLSEAGGEAPMAFAPSETGGPQPQQGAPLTEVMLDSGNTEDDGGGLLKNVFGLDVDRDRVAGVGNTMMNVGAALMARDNPAGAAIISRMASGYSRTPKVGFQPAGTMPNGKGIMMRDPRSGAIKIVPIPEQYQGPKESTEPASVREYEYAKKNGFDGSFTDWKKSESGAPAQAEISDDDAKKLGELWLAGDDKVFGRAPWSVRQKAMTSVLNDAEKAGVNPQEVLANRAKYAGVIADERKRSQTEASFDQYSGVFVGDAKTAVEKSRAVPRSNWMPMEKLLQTSTGQLQGEGAKELAAFKEANESLARGYARALAMSGVSNQAAEQKARDLLNTAMTPEVYESVVSTMDSTVRRAGLTMRQLHDNQRARNSGKPLPHPDLADENKSVLQLLEGTPQAGEQKASEKQPSSVIQKLPDGAQQHSDGYFYWQENGKWKRAKAQ